MSKRFDAFREDPPQGWVPAVGEAVYFRSGIVSFATIDMVLAADLFKVRFHYGGRLRKKVVGIADVRPAPKPR